MSKVGFRNRVKTYFPLTDGVKSVVYDHDDGRAETVSESVKTPLYHLLREFQLVIDRFFRNTSSLLSDLHNLKTQFNGTCNNLGQETLYLHNPFVSFIQSINHSPKDVYKILEKKMIQVSLEQENGNIGLSRKEIIDLFVFGEYILENMGFYKSLLGCSVPQRIETIKEQLFGYIVSIKDKNPLLNYYISITHPTVNTSKFLSQVSNLIKDHRMDLSIEESDKIYRIVSTIETYIKTFAYIQDLEEEFLSILNKLKSFIGVGIKNLVVRKSNNIVINDCDTRPIIAKLCEQDRLVKRCNN